MTSSIVSAIADVLTPDIVNKIAIASGLDRSTAQKAVSAAVPAILSGIADAVGKPEKAQTLTNAIADLPTDVLENIGGAFAGPAEAATEGRGILSSLLGSSAPALLASSIARYLGISGGAAQTVLGLVVPPILSTLSRLQRANGLNSSGLARLLIKQKEEIADAMLPVFVAILVAVWTATLVVILDLGAPRLGAARTDTAVYDWTLEGMTGRRSGPSASATD
jgi:hypothetical protein